MQQISKQPAFELGQIVATPGALAALKKAGQQPGEFLKRHANREWGDLDEDGRRENDYSLAPQKLGSNSCGINRPWARVSGSHNRRAAAARA